MPRLAALPFLLFLLPAAHSQAMPDMPDMPGMTMPPQPSMQMNMDMTSPTMQRMMHPLTLADTILNHDSSGTTIQPTSTPMPMYMRQRGPWTFMLHGTAFLTDTQQHATPTPTSPPTALCTQLTLTCVTPTRRGTDKLFSTNWIMPMAMRPLGTRGQLTLRTMLDIEPATIQQGRYPELFQQGETAQGRTIYDGQHPHDFIMELAALYDLRLSHHTLLSLYAAPIGDPTIGPTAYPHRQSASEDPNAALGHHQQDSTHIAFNVFTAGLTYRTLRLEGSGFHGAEPTEARWHFQPSPNGLAVDSYSTRLTFAPTPNLVAQYSIARITSPEQLHPTEDQRRQTASVMYNRPSPTGNLATTALWGQALSLKDGTLVNSYLLEALLNFHTRNFTWTRIESAGRTSDLLQDASTQFALNPNASEIPLGHVQAYTLGYDRQYRLASHLLAAPGAQFTLYRTPTPLVSTYGRTPFAAQAFIRFRITQ